MNPATGQTIQIFEELTDREIEASLDLAHKAFRQYRRTSFSDRAQWMTRAAEILESEKVEFGRLMTAEMGKPLKAAIDENRQMRHGGAGVLCGEIPNRILSDQAIATSATHSYVRFQPIGPILAVMPWNFPFWQVFRFIAPTLMAGNVGLLKHASNVPQCAIEIENIMRRAGFPEGAFQTLLIGSKQVARVLHRRSQVAATTSHQQRPQLVEKLPKPSRVSRSRK